MNTTSRRRDNYFATPRALGMSGSVFNFVIVLLLAHLGQISTIGTVIIGALLFASFVAIAIHDNDGNLVFDRV